MLRNAGEHRGRNQRAFDRDGIEGEGAVAVAGARPCLGPAGTRTKRPMMSDGSTGSTVTRALPKRRRERGRDPRPNACPFVSMGGNRCFERGSIRSIAPCEQALACDSWRDRQSQNVRARRARLPLITGCDRAASQANVAASSASNRRSLRPRTVSLKRSRNRATVVAILTATVGHTPARPRDGSWLEAWLRATISAPAGAGSSNAMRTCCLPGPELPAALSRRGATHPGGRGRRPTSPPPARGHRDGSSPAQRSDGPDPGCRSGRASAATRA